ncbi:hypothetical protein NE865_10156 [Phthorimaea operculella]|nr:hypothetical protein NE865_10156 [Phthorimaea operculella]
MSSFHEKKKALFDQLKEAEEQISFCKNNKASPEQDFGTLDRHTYRRIKHEMKQFRGRESIYKRKELNMQQCLRRRTIPDHMKNPQKYQYYSLSDVTQDQMSDATNTATALAFIREMEKREENAKMEPEFDDTGVFKKPTFQASKTIKKEEDHQEEKPVFKSNKIIMPEYVVGMSKKKDKKPKSLVKDRSSTSANNEKKAELKLNHLFDDCDEEE